MSGPYLPDHGERPTEVTVTRDGTHVVVCGVLATSAAIRRERVAREQRQRQEAEEREWTARALAVVEVDGVSLRIAPSGRVESRGEERPYWIDAAIETLLAAVPGRRVWWEGASVWHVRACGCVVWPVLLVDLALMPHDWRPPAGGKPACKRSLRKLAAEVTQ